MGKRILRAFAVGAGAGVIGQIIVLIVSQFVTDPTATTLLSMLLFGVVAAVLIVTGIYGKIAKFGGEGAGLALSGLMFGATGACVEKIKNGESKVKAVFGGFWSVFKVLGIGFIISMVLGMIFG